jgi:hypothetical protein
MRPKVFPDFDEQLFSRVFTDHLRNAFVHKNAVCVNVKEMFFLPFLTTEIFPPNSERKDTYWVHILVSQPNTLHNRSQKNL